MSKMNRRDFFRVVGVSGTAGLVACDPKSPAEQLYPYVIDPEEITPGLPTYYATVVEGCSVLAKVREGRVVHIESNPNRENAGVSPAAQASVQETYDPDRAQGPQVGGAAASWDEALGTIAAAVAANPAGTRWLGRYRTGSLQALISGFVSGLGGQNAHWEPHGHSVLANAAKIAWGSSAPPAFDMSGAEVIVSFGADFLHTWSDSGNHCAGWAQARSKDNGHIAHFTAIEPRVSNTSAKADTWLSTRPGTEAGVARALAKLVADEKGSTGAAKAYLAGVDVAAAASAAGIPEEKLKALASAIASKPSVVFPGGVTTYGSDATDLALAVLVLNQVAGNVGTSVLPDGNPLGPIHSYTEAMDAVGGAEVLFIDGLDPVFSSPSGAAQEVIAAAKLVVVFGNSMPEGMPEGTILLPPGSELETWGDHQLGHSFMALQQPAMKPLYNTRSVGDALLSLSKHSQIAPLLANGTEAVPTDDDGGSSTTDFAAADFQSFIKGRWNNMHVASGDVAPFSSAWVQALRVGGINLATTPVSAELKALPAPGAATLVDGTTLLLFSHQNLLDGRHANKAWLQEIPETLSGYTWGTWAEISPATADRLGVSNKHTLTIKSASGSIEAGVSVSKGMRDDAVAVVVGNGHKTGNRYSKDYGANPAVLVNGLRDAKSGEVAWLGTSVEIAKGAADNIMSKLNGHTDQDGRPLARASYVKDVEEAGPDAETGSLAPGLGIPLDPRIPEDSYDMYPEPEHPTYRFGMSIDLDSCTGCTSCQVACASENNIAIAGPEQHRKSRYMGWIRMDAFWEGEGDNPDVRFLPVMCQQCSHAPCEGVCPVLATYHNLDGLNAMIYNRCVGTRYCANNCPYSARRFNYHTFRWPESYNLMLNPDVSTREMGVMEKCTFCIQRIRYAKANHRANGIDVVPNDVLESLPACVSACPTGAMTFGNLKDENATVSKIASGPRAYQMLDALNTKPGVRYLTKVVHTKPVDPHHGGGHGDDHSSNDNH
ncbi:MAG: 4Fe-4S dicluster domain-containing protein [Myxococcota bacterium]|nr:4Fe-4S dicluster domain-containing protein [Myxococcota bacterium]